MVWNRASKVRANGVARIPALVIRPWRWDSDEAKDFAAAATDESERWSNVRFDVGGEMK